MAFYYVYILETIAKNNKKRLSARQLMSKNNNRGLYSLIHEVNRQQKKKIKVFNRDLEKEKQDILHIIEFEKCTVKRMCQLHKRLKEILIEMK